MIRGIFKNQFIFSKVLIFIGILLTGFGLSTFLAIVMSGPLFGIDAINNPGILSDFNNPENVYSLKFMQFLNSFGVFILPVFLFAFLVADDWKKYLSLDYRPQFIFFGIAALSMLFFFPWINLLVEWNANLFLPGFLEPIENWMREEEKNAEVITRSFLVMHDLNDFLINILIMAVIPAIGEELLFRGVLQQQLTFRFGNHHLGIWIAAFLFSAIHLQFFGFFPRMLLGAFFGYLLVWTRSIWIPMLAHFLNNAGAVSVHYYFDSDTAENEVDTFGTSFDDVVYLAASALLLYFLLRFTWKIRVRVN